MEKKVQIPTEDNYIIYGTLNWQESQLKKLIIFVHGFSESKDSHQFFNAAKFFPKYGFATFRFNLYDNRDGGRVLHECSIKTHSSDVDRVLDYFQNKYDEVYLVGHSLGGPSILYSSQKVKAIVLWDPSIVLNKKSQSDWRFDENRKLYTLRSDKETFVSKQMYDEHINTGEKMLEEMVVQTKIICAGDGGLKDRWEKVVNKIPVDHEFVTIENASHCFDEEGKEEELFDETLQYVKKMSCNQ